MARFHSNAMRFGIAIFSFLTMSFLCLGSAAVQADQQSPTTFDIPAQPLGQALADYAEQADVLIFAPADLTRGKQSQPVSGAMTPRLALNTLLDGHPLDIQHRDDGTIAIREVQSENDAQEQSRQDRNSASGNRNRDDEAEDDESDEDDVADLGRITVTASTGTNIRGVQNPTTPLLQFDRDDINLSGAATVQEFLGTVPQNFGSESILTASSGNPFDSNNNLTQSSSVDLRGLGVGSTLTLLNGRRLAPVGLSNFVDVNVLPLGAIERIDIQTDGASAVYGSDAVGGVVNFVTRSDYEGFEISGRYGSVTDGSKEDWGIGAAGGIGWLDGNLVLGIDYQAANPLLISERDFVDSDTLFSSGTFGGETERFGLVSSASQDFTDWLTSSVNVLYSDYSSENTRSNNNAPFTDRAEQMALSVNARLDASITDELVASLFVDYGLNEAETDDSRDDFQSPGFFDNGLILVEGQLSGVLFSTDAGDARFATGALFREEDFEQRSVSAGAEATFVKANREVSAVYGELLVPLIGESNRLSFIQRAEVSLAARYEDYSDVGDTFDPKVGVFLGFNNQFSVRVSYSESFRAPDLRSLNASQEFTIAALPPADLFIAVDPPAPDPRLANSFFPDAVITLLPSGIGNPDLVPERAKTWSAGFDLEPEFLDGLSISVNYFDIDYDDRLENVFAFDGLFFEEFSSLVDIPPNLAEIQSIFDSGANGELELFFPPTFLVPFDVMPEDITVLLRGGFLNVAERNVRGVDINLNYTRETDLGRFSSGLNLVHNIDFEGRPVPSAESVNQIDLLYRPLGLKLRGNASWSAGGLTVQGALNYAGEYEDNINDTDIDAWITADASLFYSFDNAQGPSALNGVSIGVSVRNVFDEEPPFVDTFDGLNYDSANADPFGRMISATIRKSF